MGLRDWFNKADALEVTHKGAAVLHHPNTIAADEAAWTEEFIEEEKGRKAHKALTELFNALDEEIDDED
jgi:hypothetical protein